MTSDFYKGYVRGIYRNAEKSILSGLNKENQKKFKAMSESRKIMVIERLQQKGVLKWTIK